MLIVSQDKKTIINLDRITEIGTNGKDIAISDAVGMEYGEVIGMYETEERARKVLQEIIGAYRLFSIDSNNSATVRPKVYELPQK